MCYEWVTGRLPYSADNTMAQLRAIIDRPLIDPVHHHAGVHPHLRGIMLRALAKNSSDRYSNAESMARDLRQFSRGERPSTQQPQWAQLVTQGWRHRSTIARWSLVGMLIMIGLLLTVTVVRRNQAEKLTQALATQADSFEQRLEGGWTPMVEVAGALNQQDHGLTSIQHSTVTTQLAYRLAINTTIPSAISTQRQW